MFFFHDSSILTYIPEHLLFYFNRYLQHFNCPEMILKFL